MRYVLLSRAALLPIVLLAAFLFHPTAVSADTITISATATVTLQGDSTYLWQYTVTQTNNSRLSSATGPGNPQDFFSVFDFAGYVAGSLAFTPSVSGLLASHFSMSTPLLDPTGVSSADDDATILNLRATYTGPGFQKSGTGTIGVLSAKSIFGKLLVPPTDRWVSSDTNNGGNPTSNNGLTEVPVVPPPLVVPAPAAIWGGFGLLTFLVARKLVCALK